MTAPKQDPRSAATQAASAAVLRLLATVGSEIAVAASVGDLGRLADLLVAFAEQVRQETIKEIEAAFRERMGS